MPLDWILPNPDKPEIRSTKFEIRNKFVLFSRREPQIQIVKYKCSKRYRGYSFSANINPASCFRHLNFEDLKIVSDFDIRISDLSSARKNTNFTTNGPIAVKVFNKDQQVIVLMLGLTVLIIGLFRPFHPVGSTLGPSRSNLTSESRHQCIIEVAGAVKNPGIYTFDKPPTASQAIQSTGGPIGERRLSFDSPGDTLNTGMRVELQGSSAECAQVIITPMSYGKRLVLGIPIELNQASVEDLAMIPGISHGLARRTVEFRESRGSFKTWNDLMCVQGIGPKKLESFRSYLNLK